MPESTQTKRTWWETSERLTTPEAAEFFGMKVGSFYVATSQGRIKLPKYPFGGRDYYKRSDCLALIESKVVEA